VNNTGVGAPYPDCKPKFDKNCKLVRQNWLVDSNVVPGSKKDDDPGACCTWWNHTHPPLIYMWNIAHTFALVLVYILASSRVGVSCVPINRVYGVYCSVHLSGYSSRSYKAWRKEVCSANGLEPAIQLCTAGQRREPTDLWFNCL